MYREPQQQAQTTDTYEDKSDESDLLINNLIYEMPRSLSLAVSRNYVQQFPQRATYDMSSNRSDTIVFDLNTGLSFVDPQNSYMKFKMKVVSPAGVLAAPTFGVGSGLNIIRETRIRSRSGTELSRTENANQYNAYRLNYTKSASWVNTIGSAMFMRTTSSPFNNANTWICEMTLPLSEIDSFFRPHKGVLLPPQVCSGLRLEFGLETIQRAFVDPAGFFNGTSTIQLSDISLMLDQVVMSDETSKILSLESSQSGLEYVYPRVFSYSATYPAGSSNINIQLSKAVSQANHIFTVLSNNTNYNLGTVDSMTSETFKVQSHQYRLGSSYYPNQVLVESATNALKGSSSYLLAMSSFDKLKSPYKESDVSLSDFTNQLSIIATDLSRNSSLAISGVPINNSRTVEALITRDASGDGVNKVNVDCYLEYTSVAKIFIDNVAVSI